MENENPWERKKTNPGIDQLLEDLKTMVVGKKGGKKPPKKNGSNKPPFSPNLNSRKIFLFVIPVLVAVLLFKSFYQVQPGEKGIVLRLGKYSKTTSSGLNFLIPFARSKVIALPSLILKTKSLVDMNERLSEASKGDLAASTFPPAVYITTITFSAKGNFIFQV